MKKNDFSLRISIKDLEEVMKTLHSSGYDPWNLPFFMIYDSDNVNWLLNNKDLFDHQIYEWDIETKKLLILDEISLKSRLLIINEDLDQIYKCGPQKYHETDERFLNESKELVLKKLKELENNN